MISINNNQTSFQEILDILYRCDKDFTPHMSKRKDIFSYSKKIFEQAEVFEAYEDSNFCGFLTMYCNDFISKSAYIVLICLFPQYRKMKIGKKLIESAISYAKLRGMKTIKLEVGIDDIAALNLYQKFGFKIIKRQNEYFIII